MNVNFNNPREMAKQAVMWFVMLVVVALALRFVLRLFGAEGAGNGFVPWLYDSTGVLLQPFRGVFADTAVRSKYVLEFQTLFAMVAYMVVGNVAMGVVDRWSAKR